MRCSGKNIRTEKTDRRCGILTESEREYLIHGNLNDSSEYAESKKKSDISARVRNGFHDLVLIQKYGDEDLKTRILNEDNRTDAIGENRELLIQSLGRFLSELTYGELVTENLFQLLEEAESEEWGETLFEALEAAARGDQKTMFKKFVDTANEVFNLPESEARQLFNEMYR